MGNCPVGGEGVTGGDADGNFVLANMAVVVGVDSLVDDQLFSSFYIVRGLQ